MYQRLVVEETKEVSKRVSYSKEVEGQESSPLSSDDLDEQDPIRLFEILKFFLAVRSFGQMIEEGGSHGSNHKIVFDYGE